nr:unnamed protein product [Callosobruchus chinensis]
MQSREKQLDSSVTQP